jgi:hypothetical protein
MVWPVMVSVPTWFLYVGAGAMQDAYPSAVLKAMCETTLDESEG